MIAHAEQMNHTPYTDTIPARGIEDGGVDTVSADDAVIRIRPVRPSDAGELTDLHTRASDDTLYRRFLGMGHHVIAAEVIRLTRPADPNHLALVAIEHHRIIGVCSYEVLADHDRAEFALFVDDAAHGRGIGTLLLRHLMVCARRRGIIDLLGEVLTSNGPMLHVAADLGRPLRAVYDGAMVEVHLALREPS